MSKSPVTAEQIRSFLVDGMESAEPAASILKYLQKYNGKKLTKRDESRMQEQIESSIRFSNRAGMCHIEWGGYRHSGGNQGGSILIAYGEGAPVIDAAWVEEKNAAYYSARIERNIARKSTLDGPSEVLISAAKAINAIREARALLDKLTEYEGPLYQARSEIDKLLEDD